jgi:Glyoxalase-like domain
MPRLRQAVLVAHELEAVSAALREALGLGEPYRDPAVSAFGLHNMVMALGDTFVEVVSPVASQTAAGRHLERRGGDAGYMVMFELADVAAARRRAADAGIREVFAVELDDIVDVHLHPADVGGAIVALDRPEPPGSWRWGGPAWEGAIPPHGPGGVRGVTVRAADPAGMAERWGHVLGVAVADGGQAPELRLDDGGAVRFVAGGDGIAGFDVEVPSPAGEHVDLGGVRFTLRPAAR